MNIKNLNVFKSPDIKVRLCAFALIGTIATTMTGCTNSKSNDSSKDEQQTSISVEHTEQSNIYLDENSSEIHSVELLSNGEKRGIILSGEPHIYKSLLEKTDTKVYLSDEYGNKLSNNFDEINLLDNYSYLTTGGVLNGDLVKVQTDKYYDLFVGKNLRKDLNGNSLGPTVTLLNRNGSELCSFNGYFKALFDNIIVVQNYFEGEDIVVGAPDTYLYNYETGKTSKKHNRIEIVRDKNETDEAITYFVGVDSNYDDNSSTKQSYSLYNEKLEIIAISNEKELTDWYVNWQMDNDISKAGDIYNAYFKFMYDNTKNIERFSNSRLK